MPRLFSYTITVDDGAAPNPFSGMCSLAICKPGIRKVAQVGDWVAGLGSKNANGRDLSQRIVYAMHIEEVVSMQDYDRMAPERWPHRIPDIESLALQDRLGDCIYNFSSGFPVQRKGVHGAGNMEVDLKGQNVLISRDFYYFGNQARLLPENLLPICHQNQGHKSNANRPYFDQFIEWIRNLVPSTGQIYGWPDYIIDWGNLAGGGCATRQYEDANDIEC